MTTSNTSSLQVARDILIAQFEIAWSLTSYHLATLSTEECLWRPAVRCLHVNQDAKDGWHADWPEHEAYDIGPPSIAWTTWHICFWWRKSLEHSQGNTSLTKDDVRWPGTADNVRAVIDDLRSEWLRVLTTASDDDLAVSNPSSWPLPNSTLASIAAWLNVELTKNAAEIGLVRFLYAANATK